MAYTLAIVQAIQSLFQFTDLLFVSSEVKPEGTSIYTFQVPMEKRIGNVELFKIHRNSYVLFLFKASIPSPMLLSWVPRLPRSSSVGLLVNKEEIKLRCDDDKRLFKIKFHIECAVHDCVSFRMAIGRLISSL